MTHLFRSSLRADFQPSTAGLYVITCLPQQKHYIGESATVTSRSRSRLRAHKSRLRRGIHENSLLQVDFQKYGEDAFLFHWLLFGFGQTQTSRQHLETLILVLETLSPEKRYNVYTNWRRRGPGANAFTGKTHTALELEQARQAQAVSKSGHPSPFAARTQSSAAKGAVSAANRGKAGRRKPVMIDNVSYESISEAHEQTGLARRLIRERCNSQEPRFANYTWIQDMSDS